MLSQISTFWQANKFKRAEWFWKWTQLTKDILMSGDEVDWIRVEKTHHHWHSCIFSFGCFTYKNSYSKIISSGNYTNWGLSRSQSFSRLRLEQLLRIFRALQTSRVLHISMNARWHMNQLLVCIYCKNDFISFCTSLTPKDRHLTSKLLCRRFMLFCMSRPL